MGDETRLRQILINLLGNAVKFTQHGEVTLTVSSHMLAEPADTYELLFVVHDSGIGIPPERQERLFQSFSQVDASTTRKYGGTGLGLAISQRLCEAMGGHMWVESVGIAGKGTDFCFTLPLAEALLVPPAVHDAGDVLRNKHIVLVLGNRGAAVQWRSLALQAQLWGMEARFCSSLDELAAWRAAGKPVDVAVIDQQSVSATHELAGADVPELAGLRWLILAPLGHHEPVSGITIAGYVSKPVKSAQWKHALMQALDGTPRPD